MKILVCVHRIPEPHQRPHLTEDGHLKTACLRYIVSPEDEIALDTSAHLKASGSEIVAVSCGAMCLEETLLTALARGADRALGIEMEDALRPEIIAAQLAVVARRESPGLILCSMGGHTGPRLAGILGVPFIAGARDISITSGRVRVVTESEEVTAPLPAVVTVDGSGGTPGLLSLYDIVAATQKPRERVAQTALPIHAPASRGYEPVPTRSKCRMAADIDELLRLLHGMDAEPLQGIPNRHYVGVEEEADTLAWIAGGKNMPLVSHVTDTCSEGVMYYQRSTFYDKLSEKILVAPSQEAIVIVSGRERTAEQQRNTERLIGENPLPPLERKPLPQTQNRKQQLKLATARVVVAGGRALKDAATFERLVGGLADALGGAVAASGEATNGGTAPAPLLVGQSGTTVAPDLYVALGISGVDQHIGGIQNARTVVAINSDPRAPIFEFADFGLVADLNEAVPEWIARLQ